MSGFFPIRPFFSYYGMKYSAARHYGPPRRDLVIEPFAGGAGYSTFWGHPNVRLYDLDEDVCALWDFLINCSADDIRAIPDTIYTNEEWLALPRIPRLLVQLNINFGACSLRKSLSGPYLDHVNGRGTTDWMHLRRLWSARTKQIIIDSKPRIAAWTITNCSYADIPMEEAHWHVDPPYQGAPGRKYRHDGVDFAHLGDWCRNLPGAVDVCEQAGADWLPFRPFKSLNIAKGKTSEEVIWSKDPDKDAILEELFGWEPQ